MVKISIVIPIYNEAKKIENCIRTLQRVLPDITEEYEIIIAEDGSKDETKKIIKKITTKSVTILSFRNRLGRGCAITKAIKKAKYNYVIYMDVDLSTDIKSLSKIIEELKKGAAIVTGSRLLLQSQVKRSTTRTIASMGYNFLVRLLLRSKIHDHQCGFKGFNKALIQNSLNETTDKHWFWDTEVLITAQKNGLKVVEVPVKWKESDQTKVNLVIDTVNMGKKIIELFVRGRNVGRSKNR